MVIYTAITGEANSSEYYRLRVPLQTMEKMGLDVEIIVDPLTTDVPSARRAEALMWSDIVWLYQATDPLMRRNMQVIGQRPGVKQDERVFLPPNFVIDTDDNLFCVHHLNPAFQRLGVLRTDGAPMFPNEAVNYINDKGEEVVLWKDGVNGFNVAENMARLEDYRSLCQTAKTMTCSTPRAEQYVKREIGPDTRTFVNPNCVRFDHYDDVHLAPHKGVRILWQGTRSHYDDLYRIREPLQRVMKKYPEAELIMWGLNMPSIVGDIPKEQVRHIPFMDHTSYTLKLVHLGHDIALAPLHTTTFNDSRSAIKWYEASLLHDPAVTLAQRSGAYQDEMVDGESGMLFNTPEEFEEKLCTLIENENLRRTLATNAKQWLHENRDAFKVVPKLYEFFQTLRSEKLASTDLSKLEIVSNEPSVPAVKPNVRKRKVRSRKNA